MKGGVTTRAKARETNEPQVSLPEERIATRTVQRSLSNEEKKMLKTFILAFIADYEKNFRDEGTTPTQEWKDISNYLTRLNKKTISKYQKLVKSGVSEGEAKQQVLTEDFEDASENDVISKRWRQISLDFLQSGIENMNPVFNHMKSVRNELANRFAENFSMARVLPEGNVRLNILRNYTFREFLQTHRKKNFANLTNQEKLDFIMVLNDPSSKLFQSLLHEIQARSFANAKSMIMLTADILDSEGKKIGEKKFNVNTHKGDGVTVLFEALRVRKNVFSFNYYPQHIELIKYLINHQDIDLTIPINTKEHQGNVVSYLLLLVSGLNDAWVILKDILTTKPITAFYTENLKCLGKAYGVNIIGDKQVCIDNVWILRNLSQVQVEWLVDHGKLDMKAGYGKANLYRSLASDLDDVKDKQKKAEQEYNTTQASLQQMYDTIMKLNEEYKDLMQVRNVTQEESRKATAELATIQQLFDRLEPFFERHKIYGGGKKRNTKREKKV